MEFWDGRERQASLYAKYRTIPGWSSSSSHTYANKTPESRSEGHGWMGEPSSWAVPGSRTGGMIRDCVNWTDEIPSSHCPDYHHQELASYATQERGFERQRALMERQAPRRELSKWQPATLYRREKDKLGGSSYRELEAWANRYYHSLPRQRHAEVGAWGSSPHRPDSEKMLSGSTGRPVGAEPNQRAPANSTALFNPERCDLSNRLRVQLETWKSQQPPPYTSARQSLPRKASGLSSKENVVQGPLFSQPPNYTPPPAYGTPQGPSTLPKPRPAMEYRVESRPVTSMFPALRRTKLSVPLAEGEQSMDHSLSVGIPRPVTNSDPDAGETLGAPRPTQKPDAALLQLSRNSEVSSSDTGPSRQNRLTRRRGGETVFCLVSRMGEIAGMSSSPGEPLKSHSLPLLRAAAPATGSTEQVSGTTDSERERGIQEPVQLPDEVDSGGATQQCGPLMSIEVESMPKGLMEGSQTQISDCTFRDTHEENLHSDIQPKPFAQCTEKRSFMTRKKEEKANAGAFHKNQKTDLWKPDSQAEPTSQTTTMFPLWKQPKWNHCSKAALEKKNETYQETSHSVQSGQATEGQAQRAEVLKSAVRDQGRGLVVIDASCVVVKVEFIFPPEKEHVQYVCSRSADSCEHGSNSLNLQVQTNEHNDPYTPSACDKIPLTKNKTQELHVKIEDQHDHVIKATSEMCHDIISKSETLKERAERILGIRFQNHSDGGQTWDEKEDSLESSECLPTEDSEGYLKSEIAEHSTEDVLTIIKDKESQTLKNVDGLPEGSNVKFTDAGDAVGTDVTIKENKGTSEDKRGMEEDFTMGKDTIGHSFECGPFDEINYGYFLDGSGDIMSYSLGQEGHPREDDPSGETGDITKLCPSLLGDFIEVSSEVLDREGTPSEGTLSDQTDMRSLCPNPGEYLDQKSNPKDGLAREAEAENDLGLPENTNESFGQESSSRKAKPLNAKSGIDHICPPLPELLDEGDMVNLLEERDGMKSLYLPLLGNITEHTVQLLGSTGSRNEENLPDPTNDMQIPPNDSVDNNGELLFGEGHGDPSLSHEADGTMNLCSHCVKKPSQLFDNEGTSISDHQNEIQMLLGSCVGNTSEFFIQELGSREDMPPNEKAPSLLLENVDEPFVKEGVAREGTLAGTDNIQNVCLSLLSVESTKELLDEDVAPWGVMPSNITDDKNDQCPVLHHYSVENTCDPFAKEEAPKQVVLSDEFNWVLNPNQLLDKEVRYQDENKKETTDDLKDLCLSLCDTSMKNTIETFSQEHAPVEDACFNLIHDESNLCSPLYDIMEDSRDLLGLETNEAVLPSALHLQVPCETEAACPSPLETPPHFTKPPHHLEPELLAASLAGTLESGLQIELPLTSCFGPEINNQTLPSSCILPHSGFPTLPSPPSNPALHPRHSEFPHEAGEAIFFSSALSVKRGRGSQYPESLWDAVNRIRKHTAPDSENEEEEGGEFWEPMENTSEEADPESQSQEPVLKETMSHLLEGFDGNTLEDVCIAPDVLDRMPRGSRTLGEGGRLGEVLQTWVPSQERIEVEDMGQTGDDTLSNSSLDSQDSNDTVIEGEEDEKMLESDEEGGEL